MSDTVGWILTSWWECKPDTSQSRPGTPTCNSRHPPVSTHSAVCMTRYVSHPRPRGEWRRGGLIVFRDVAHTPWSDTGPSIEPGPGMDWPTGTMSAFPVGRWVIGLAKCIMGHPKVLGWFLISIPSRPPPKKHRHDMQRSSMYSPQQHATRERIATYQETFSSWMNYGGRER